jgi:DNA-binding PadR family transcriptional regulator
MATRTVRDTSGDITRIVLLGALRRGPAHGYELKSRLRSWHMEWWADIQSGSIYASLKRLERDGLVERTRTEQDGKRPVRQIFRITPAGADELRRLIADAWRGVTRFSRPIDMALSFYDVLEPSEIKEHLDTRLATLQQLRVAFETDNLPGVELGAYQKQMVPDLRAHERMLLDAEVAFTQLLIERFEQGAYSAP